MIIMKNILLVFTFWKLNLLSAMEYKISFFIQIFSMIINDFLFFLVWIFFFEMFWKIGWLDMWTFALLLSIMVMVFWIVHTFFNGYLKIWQMIEEGRLDTHLLLPKNILLRLITWSLMVSAIWDILYAFLLMFLIPNLTLFLIFQIIFFSIIWSATFIWFMLIFTSLSFFIWGSKNIVNGMFEALLWPSHYPPNIFEWTILKYIFMTIIPIYFVVSWPFDVIVNFTFTKFIILISWSMFFVFAGSYVFYKWLKKYESGNMMYTNV
jgi:ABC-2 type transport system permease protein